MDKKTLIMGASTNPDRYANFAIKKLRANGIEVVAFGIKAGIVGDVKIDTERIPYESIHTVSLYLNPKHQKQYYDYILNLNPKRVIFNPGTENPEFFNLLENKGIAHELSCTLVLLSTNQY